MPHTLQLINLLTETSATLTFINPTYKIDNSHTSNTQHSLAALESALHQGIYHKDFIRHFKPAENTITSIRKHNEVPFDSAFASMAHMAFSQHKTIELRPDDLHLLIIQGISRFIQKYPEEFRKRFVTFEGKQKVVVRINDINDKETWDHVPRMFASAIKLLTQSPTTVDLLMQKYSQSTETDQTVKAITLMGTFSAYFNYAVSSLCFIPEFILQGTEHDWEMLSTLPEKIIAELQLNDNLDLENPSGINLLHRWLTRLSPVLRNMYLARTGTLDSEFWLSFYKLHSESGGPKITGNLVFFYPFLKDKFSDGQSNDFYINPWILKDKIYLGTHASGAGGPDTSQLTANIIEVSFQLEHVRIIKDDDEFNTEVVINDMGMKAGIVAFNESYSGKILSSHVDFSIFYKSRKPMILDPKLNVEISKSELYSFKSKLNANHSDDDEKESMNNGFISENGLFKKPMLEKLIQLKIQNTDEYDNRPTLEFF